MEQIVLAPELDLFLKETQLAGCTTAVRYSKLFVVHPDEKVVVVVIRSSKMKIFIYKGDKSATYYVDLKEPTCVSYGPQGQSLVTEDVEDVINFASEWLRE